MQVRQAISAALITGLLALSPVVSAEKDQEKPGKVIAGWVEKIILLDNGDEPIKAKLDSGAKTSSLHASKIEKFQRDGDDWVRFTFVDKQGEETEFERPEVRGVKIKDLDGGFDRRPVVEMDICFDGRLRTTQFTLADREGFVYRILLGRRFLAGVAVIDSEATYLTKEHCTEVQQKKDKDD
tara:strand:+ start:264 stop:809 length:546 start_codon:yes stop_codon:yes gene_type:complete